MFCKGLHCAGCGKGIPVGIVLLIIGIIVASNQRVGNALGGLADAIATGLIIMAIAIPCAIVITGALMAYIGARFSGLTVSRWNGPTYSQQWELANRESLEPAKHGLPQWPNRPAIEAPKTVPAEWWINQSAHDRSGQPNR